MSAEAITTVLPRNANPRPAEPFENDAGLRHGAADLLEKLQATARGEGTREEDNRFDHRQNDARARGDPRPQPVGYPPAGPSLPPPLVPIREVPDPEHILYAEENPATEALRELLGPEPERAGGGIDPEATRETASIVREGDSEAGLAIGDSGSRERASQMAAARSDRNELRGADVEQTLKGVVMAQAHDARPVVKVDTEFAGEIFAAEA